MKQSALFLLFASIILIVLGSIYVVDSKREGLNNEIGYGVIFSGVFLLGISVFVMLLRLAVR